MTGLYRSVVPLVKIIISYFLKIVIYKIMEFLGIALN